MKSIVSIRNQLGLSQTELAEKLGISRSLLAKAESNRGPLQSAQILKLLALEKRLKESSVQTPESLSFNYTIKYCTNRLRNNKQALYVLEMKHETMQKNAVAIPGLPADIAAGSAHVKRIKRRYTNYGKYAQEVVKVKIDLLLHENKMLEAYITRLSGEHA